jgi:hypothetical protein
VLHLLLLLNKVMLLLGIWNPRLTVIKLRTKGHNIDTTIAKPMEKQLAKTELNF